MRPDLSGADLAGLELDGVDLSQADLRHANLQGAWLWDAKFDFSDLTEADLSRAKLADASFAVTRLGGCNMRYARLQYAHLVACSMAGADLSRAILRGTVLRYCDVASVNFDRAEFGNTVLSDVDLTRARGLDSTRHSMPSSLGVDTLLLSATGMSLTFMRNCGLSKQAIAWAESIRQNPVSYSSCFISYSAKDEAFATRLHADLQARGVRAWYFPESAKWGRGLWHEIDDGIAHYDRLVVICSRYSLQSGPVLREMERALAREDREKRDILFPVRTDDYVLRGWTHPRKGDICSKVIGDFRKWRTSSDAYGEALRRLLMALQRIPKSRSSRARAG